MVPFLYSGFNSPSTSMSVWLIGDTKTIRHYHIFAWILVLCGVGSMMDWWSVQPFHNVFLDNHNQRHQNASLKDTFTHHLDKMSGFQSEKLHQNNVFIHLVCQQLLCWCLLTPCGHVLVVPIVSCFSLTRKSLISGLFLQSLVGFCWVVLPIWRTCPSGSLGQWLCFPKPQIKPSTQQPEHRVLQRKA